MVYRIRLILYQRNPIHPVRREEMIPISESSLIKEASFSIKKVTDHVVGNFRN